MDWEIKERIKKKMMMSFLMGEDRKKSRIEKVGDWGSVDVRGKKVFWDGVRVANVFTNDFQVGEIGDVLVIRIPKTKFDEVEL